MAEINETKFIQYVRKLHSEKNSLQHRCKISLFKKGPVKENWWRRFKKRMYQLYVYVILLPYNYHSTKLYYESNESVDHARKDHIKNHPYILHPFSRIRVFVDNVVFIPYLSVQIYFGTIPGFGLTIGSEMFTQFCSIMCFIGTLHVVLNFFTGYCIRKKKKVILKPWLITKRYCLTYLVVDIGMVLPYLMHIWDLRKPYSDIAHYIPFIRIVSYWNYIENLLRIWLNDRRLIYRIMLAIKAATCLHMCTCFIGYFKNSQETQSLKTKHLTEWGDHFISYLSELIRITSRLYYSAAVNKPSSITITTLLLLTVLFGTFVFSYVIAAVLMEALAETNQEIEYNALSAEVRNFARQEHRDPTLRKRIVQMFDVIFLGTLLKEQRVKLTIPDNLRRDLNSETIGALLRSTEYISQLDNYLLLRLLDKLKLIVLLPNDHLVAEGEKGESMYFLSTGRLVLYRLSVEVGHLDDGDNFAEQAVLIDDYTYTETVIAGTPCFVYTLSRTDYITSYKG